MGLGVRSLFLGDEVLGQHGMTFWLVELSLLTVYFPIDTCILIKDTLDSTFTLYAFLSGLGRIQSWLNKHNRGRRRRFI